MMPHHHVKVKKNNFVFYKTRPKALLPFSRHVSSLMFNCCVNMKPSWNIQAMLWATTTALVPRQADSRLYQPCTGDYCYDIIPLPPRFFLDLEPQRLQIKYGPFTVPPAHENHGRFKTYFRTNPPCYDCYLTAVKADLQYPNSTTANTNTNLLSLHHVAIMNLVQSSTTCLDGAEIIFASGDERAEAKVSLDGQVPAGYYINPHDLLLFSPELMNTAHIPQESVIVVYYEFVPSSDLSVEAGFKKVTPIWLDVDGTCSPNAGAVPVPMGAGERFSLEMEPAWKSDVSGDVLFVMGHVHDGGASVEVVRNERTVCEGVVRYAEEEYLEKRQGWRGRGKGKGKNRGKGKDKGKGTGGGGDDDRDEEQPSNAERGVHISSISTCTLPGRIEKGYEWTVKANYDFGNHAPMKHGGLLAPVMGASLMYVVEDGQ